MSTAEESIASTWRTVAFLAKYGIGSLAKCQARLAAELSLSHCVLMNHQSTFKIAVSPARIMIVSEHDIERDRLAALLSGHADLVVNAVVEDIAGALLQLDAYPPDIVVVDISREDESGIEWIRWLKEQHPSIRILGISLHNEDLYGERVLAAGAKGYLHKQVDKCTLENAVRRVLDGDTFLSDETLQGILTCNSISIRPNEPQGIDMLSARELEVFHLIGLGLTTAQIAARLQVSIKTIETHRQKIKGRLRLLNSSELSREAVQWVTLNR